MRTLRYVAMSLDGYIAGPRGEADWIEMDPAVDVAAFFKEFYAQFDIALMGRKTYELVKGPIEGMSTYVFSRTLSLVRVALHPDGFESVAQVIDAEEHGVDSSGATPRTVRPAPREGIHDVDAD